jgi:hypothetical protein
MVQEAGPVYPGGIETVATDTNDGSYHILYLPDRNNDELQAAGQPAKYYWFPEQVRIARKGDTGDYKFHLLHFVGIRSGETTVGVSGTEEVSGGVLSLTVTSAPPLAALQNSHDQLLERFRGDDQKYWGWRTPAAPQFAPMPVAASRSMLSNLSPTAQGTLPTETPSPNGGVTSPGAPGAPGSPGAPGRSRAGSNGLAALRPRRVRDVRTLVRSPERDATPGNLGAWFVNIQGQGPGSIDPAGENAYTALVGALPAAILWQGFHGAYSPVSVTQSLLLKVWSETLHIEIHGNWDRIFEHFSAAASGHAYWFSADIKAEFNKLLINGGITVKLEIDGTLPNADKMREAVDKRIDLIVNKFTEQAKQRIFDPAQPNVEPASSAGGTGGALGAMFSPYQAGFGLKYRRDQTKLDLNYDETIQERFLLPTTISSTLEGFYNEIKADPQAERKYFSTLYLDDWDRKVTRTVKPVVNWPDPARQWVGDPVSFLSVQVGYPSTNGDLLWQGRVFSSTDTGTATTWQPVMARKNAADVVNAPAGWTPDTTFVKRAVHFTEPPGETDNPYVRAFVEKNVIPLDPEPNGTALNDINLEVRADSVGKLEVGPIVISALLDSPSQMVEVSFQALGKNADGNDRTITKLVWRSTDQDKDRYWEIFTGQPDFVPAYRYQVRVIVRGSLFTKGMEWTGPWVESAGNGPLTVTVPTPEEAVTRRSLVAARPAQQPGEEPSVTPATTPVGAPPGTRRAASRRDEAAVGEPVAGYRVSGGTTPAPRARSAGDVERRREVPIPTGDEGAETAEPAVAGYSPHAPGGRR